jgi:hypothetical protein
VIEPELQIDTRISHVISGGSDGFESALLIEMPSAYGRGRDRR